MGINLHFSHMIEHSGQNKTFKIVLMIDNGLQS